MGNLPFGDVRPLMAATVNAMFCPNSSAHIPIRVTALAYQKPGLVKVPWVPCPAVDRDAHQHEWTNYPISSEKVKSHIQCLFKATSDVSLITYELGWSLFGTGDRERKLDTKSVQAAEEAYARLQRWHEELPDCLGTSNAPPHVLCLQFVLDGIPRGVL